MKRRQFIKTTSLVTGLAGLAAGYAQTGTNFKLPDAEKPEEDEAYWKQIRGAFDLQKDFINLENGYFSPQAFNTLKFHQQREVYVNQHTSWYMRKEQEQAVERARSWLAGFLDCNNEELALTRNTTEALNILIMGYPWKKGDEVIIGNQDYGSMVAAFMQVSKRYGVVVKKASVPLHPKSDEEVTEAYVSLITKKTRLLHLTHLINLTGQVIPVAKIAEHARSQGVEVAVDAAHSVAHLNFKLSDLKADYVGASLHKWLCNPLGAGFLYVKADKITNLWPLMGDVDYPQNNIRKLEHQGTRPVQSLEAIEEALEFHNVIGSELKQNRLRYLMQYWVSRVKDNKEITINTPWNDKERCSAIANVAVKGISATALAAELMEKHKIFTVAIEHEAVQGIRVTPHIFTSVEELDVLVKALNNR